MTSPLQPTFRKRIDDKIQLLIQNQVTPWAFLNAGPPFRIKKFDGKPISYQGIGFDGSPRNIFWGRYIEPFIENICVVEIAAAVAMAKERDVDGKELLIDIQMLLKAGCHKVFTRMSEIDQRLLGKGYPNSVQRKSIDNEYAAMTQFIETHINAELAMWKSKSRFETWYAQNKFWVWAIPIAVSVMVFLSKLLG